MEDRDIVYRRQIVKLLYFDKKLSCNNISEKINKSLPLVIKIVNDLVKEGVVVENGYEGKYEFFEGRPIEVNVVRVETPENTDKVEGAKGPIEIRIVKIPSEPEK